MIFSLSPLACSSSAAGNEVVVHIRLEPGGFVGSRRLPENADVDFIADFPVVDRAFQRRRTALRFGGLHKVPDQPAHLGMRIGNDAALRLDDQRDRKTFAVELKCPFDDVGSRVLSLGRRRPGRAGRKEGRSSHALGLAS